jgi:glucose/arabinose dehydrogenase
MRVRMTAVATAIATFVCGSAFAQSETAPPADTAPQTMQQSDSPSTAQIDQKKVEQFADAYVEVQTIQQRANEELSSTTDPAIADQVKTSAQTQMIAAVERSGLQLEEFNSIVASMAADNELRSRVSAEVQKRLETGAPASGT